MEKSEPSSRQARLDQTKGGVILAVDSTTEDGMFFQEESAMVEQFRTGMASAAKAKQAKVKIDKALRGQAHADYQAARGTAHRQLLLDAEQRLQIQFQKGLKFVTMLKNELAGLEAAHQMALRQAFVEPLVKRELPALPGIGPRLAEAIMTQVFKGNLEDLRHASFIDGIGPQKQATLNAWVAKQLGALPGLLNENFPGKEEINVSYARRLDAQRASLNKAEAHTLDLRNMLERVYRELKWLIAISPFDFEAAFAEGGSRHSNLERYILGCFPPWEPMPDWFAAAIGAGMPEPVEPSIPIHIPGLPSDDSLDSSGLQERIIIRA